MFSQSELNNYKLQVELLQEKLKRSEEHRQKLEEKFAYIMKRRSEHEKIVKVKNRLKIRQFLEEQRERNQRNKTLVQALERIDQQATVLAARSERVKILKVQYELYYSNIIRSQCPTRLIHPNYYYSSSMPMNHSEFGENNNQQRIEELLMLQNYVSKFDKNSEFGSYRYQPATSNTGYPNEPIASNRSGKQLGPFDLKSTLQLNQPIKPHINTGETVRSVFESEKQRQQQEQERDLFENQTIETYNPSYTFKDIPRSYRQQNELLSDMHCPQNQALAFDKLHAIKRDTTIERPAPTYNPNQSDIIQTEGSKSQPINSFQSTATQLNEAKMAMDETESMFSHSKIIAKVANDTSNNMLNFGGRINGQEIYPLQTKKKEKLSIATLENEIYDQPTIATSAIPDSRLETLEKMFSDTVKINSTETLPPNESYEEKSDISEKVETPITGMSNVGEVPKVSDEDLIPKPAEISHETGYTGLAQQAFSSDLGYAEYQPNAANFNQPVAYEDDMQNLQIEYLNPVQSLKEEEQEQPGQYDYSQFQTQDYQYQDPNYIPNEDSNYAQSLIPNHISTEDPSNAQNQNSNYDQDCSPNYIPNQEYDQSERYPAEYPQQQGYEPSGGYEQSGYNDPQQQSQQENIYTNEYPYNYGPDYDPNTQQYTEPQYDQQPYIESSYEQPECIEPDYPQNQQHHMNYEMENTSSTLIDEEHDGSNGQTETKDLVHSAAIVPTTQPSTPDPIKPQSQPSAVIDNEKPASILSTTEKPHDSPIDNKNKKKKRVNFIDETEEGSLSAPKINPSAGPNTDESDFDFSTSTN